VHLIRDIDDDVLRNLLDTELKVMAQQFGTLLRTVIETVNRYGLKSRHLRKHERAAFRFLDSVSSSDFSSELANKYKKRFQKSGGKMFTFLEHDGVPWNNNNSEHAIKRFAKYRRDADGRFRNQRVQQRQRSQISTLERNDIGRLTQNGWATGRIFKRGAS
jgi:transposase